MKNNIKVNIPGFGKPVSVSVLDFIREAASYFDIWNKEQEEIVLYVGLIHKNKETKNNNILIPVPVENIFYYLENIYSYSKNSEVTFFNTDIEDKYFYIPFIFSKTTGDIIKNTVLQEKKCLGLKTLIESDFLRTLKMNKEGIIGGNLNEQDTK
jgi:hypothetical protein